MELILASKSASAKNKTLAIAITEENLRDWVELKKLFLLRLVRLLFLFEVLLVDFLGIDN
jgi:hypothetical protein